MNSRIWAKVITIAGLIFGLLIQIFTLMNVAESQKAGKLNGTMITLVVVGIIVYVFLIIGTIYLFRGDYQKASNILMIAGIGALLFIYIFVGAVFIIASILTRNVYLENKKSENSKNARK